LKSQQGDILCCRFALHLIGMEEIVLAAVLDGLEACSVDTPSRRLLVPTGRSEP